MPTTFRADAVAGLRLVVDAFGTANPSTLSPCEDERPTHFAFALTLPYVSSRPETISHTAGTREREMSPSVTFVKPGTLRMSDFDVLVDSLVDWFTSYPHIVAGTIWDRMTVADDR